MEVECSSLDRISTLPQHIKECILSVTLIRDAVRTSILSKSWRYIWASVPKLYINSLLFITEYYSKYDHETRKYKIAAAILHLLWRRRCRLVEFIWLTYLEIDWLMDSIICYLLTSHNLKRFKLVYRNLKPFKISCPSVFLKRLKDLELHNFEFELLKRFFNGFCKLTRLKLLNVYITTYSLKHLLTSCPLLDELYLVEILENSTQGDKITFAELFRSSPSIRRLAISKNYMEHFATRDMPPQLPISLVHLRFLHLGLSFMEQDKLLCAFCLIKSSPNLTLLSVENEQLRFRNFQPIVADFLDLEELSGFKLDHLEEFVMENFSNLAIEKEMLKLVMAKSPVLERVIIKLNDNVSIDEEPKILKDPIPRASPLLKFSVKRREYTGYKDLAFTMPLN